MDILPEIITIIASATAAVLATISLTSKNRQENERLRNEIVEAQDKKIKIIEEDNKALRSEINDLKSRLRVVEEIPLSALANYSKRSVELGEVMIENQKIIMDKLDIKAKGEK